MPASTKNSAQVILVLEDEEDLLEVLVTIIESVAEGARVLPCTNLKAALDTLGKEPVTLVVSDRRLPDGDGADLFLATEKMSPPVPFILCSSDRQEDVPALRGKRLFGAITKPSIVGPLDLLLRKFLEAGTAPDASPPPAPAFARVRIHGLLKAQPLPCDLYLKASDSKFVKIFHAGSMLTEADLENYAQKCGGFLHVPVADLSRLLDCMVLSVISRLISESSGQADEINDMQAAQNLLQDTLLRIGLTPNAQKLAKASAERAIHLLAASPDCSAYLNRILSSPGDYLSAHSLVLSAVACTFASTQPWNTKEILLKISLAALFHDITLNNPELAGIDSLEELNAMGDRFTEEERKAYTSHPADAAELVRKLYSIPPDVDALVLQHHERPDGSGFPGKITATRINHLSAIFLLAHDFAHRFMAGGGMLKLGEFLDLHASRYEGQVFRQVLSEIGKKRSKILG